MRNRTHHLSMSALAICAHDIIGHMVLDSGWRPARSRPARSYAEQIAGEADTNTQQDQVNQIEFESLE
jgi:hypothetical protein